jgi:hypothetical protein
MGGPGFQLLTVILIQIDAHEHGTGHCDQIGIGFPLPQHRAEDRSHRKRREAAELRQMIVEGLALFVAGRVASLFRGVGTK